MSPTVSDLMWRAQDTTPDAIEAALRGLLVEFHAENASYVPARVINLVCIVDKEWSGEIANRLRQVGRYHASRTVVCAVDPRRHSLDATATISASGEPRPGEFALLRETVIVDCGPNHLTHLDSIVDPLVVTDLATVVWSPHGHPEAVDALLGLAQVVLLDSVDEPETDEALARAHQLAERVYVVDLAWLRSTPWRERIAGTFDPPAQRAELRHISSVSVLHHPDSAAAGLMFLGWLCSRLGWKPARMMSHGRELQGKVSGRRQEVDLRLAPTDMAVRGLAGVTIETTDGLRIELGRGSGGLRAVRRDAWGNERSWTILGASRGESGILGEGIRQALLRDPTYAPALAAATGLIAA
jgi:glucose-6-phosphate dehydrogenase assembly protein OpcA